MGTGLLSLLLAVSAAWCAAEPAADFDQGVAVGPMLEQVYGAAGLEGGFQASAERSEGSDDPIWISVSNEDIIVLGKSFDFNKREPVERSDKVSIFKVKISELDVLSDTIHRRLNRCGGFFAHPTLSSARRDLAAPPAAAAGTYSVDQDETVRRLLGMVDEASVTRTITTLASFKNRYYKSDTGVASARRLQGLWQELAGDRSDMSAAAYPHGGFPQDSVIMTVKGSEEPEKVVVLGGHLDSIAGWWGGASAVAPGADDNASGIAVLTEAIRVIAASGYRPRQTLKFIGYAAEEVGLRGSREIADAFKSEGVNVRGVIQFDMSNYKGSAEDIYLIEDHTHAGQNDFLAKLIETYTSYKVGRTKCGYGCSDHASWTTNGFIASFPFEATKDGANPHIHSDKDTLAQSGGNSLHAVKFARLAVAYLVEMAK